MEQEKIWIDRCVDVLNSGEFVIRSKVKKFLPECKVEWVFWQDYALAELNNWERQFLLDAYLKMKVLKTTQERQIQLQESEELIV